MAKRTYTDGALVDRLVALTVNEHRAVEAARNEAERRERERHRKRKRDWLSKVDKSRHERIERAAHALMCSMAPEAVEVDDADV